MIAGGALLRLDQTFAAARTDLSRRARLPKHRLASVPGAKPGVQKEGNQGGAAMHFQSGSGLIWEYPWTELQEWGHDLKLVGLGLGDLRRGKADQRGCCGKFCQGELELGYFVYWT